MLFMDGQTWLFAQGSEQRNTSFFSSSFRVPANFVADLDKEKKLSRFLFIVRVIQYEKKRKSTWRRQ